MRAVTDESIKNSVINVEMTKLDKDGQKTFINTLSKLSSEYDTSLQEVRMMNAKEALGNSAFASTFHHYTIDKSTIIINPLKCKDSVALSDKFKKLCSSRYCVNVREGLEKSTLQLTNLPIL